MASPTHTYCDYSTSGSDYKGATFTDGAYTSVTKTLVKLNAFTANKAGHRIYLESNDGGSIVAGLYKIATWSDASTIILATDAGAGVDDDAAKCVQHDGTTTLPWNTIQGALDLITRDATNGDQINIIAGTAQVLNAALYLTTYGTPAGGVPLVFRGCTATANDGGIEEIDCGGVTMFAANNTFMFFADLEIHNFGNNNGISTGGSCAMYHCEVHKGASTPSGKSLIGSFTHVVGCYIHDSGTTGTGCVSCTLAYKNYIYNCPTGLDSINNAVDNILVDCTTAIRMGNNFLYAIGNTIYMSTASTGTGITQNGATRYDTLIMNNIIEGYSGVGGKAISGVAEIGILGYNAFYNNATPESLLDVIFDLGNDATLAASPFTNAGAGDFSLATGVSGAIDGAFPGAWYGPASTTDHADIGAVQNGAGSGGAVKILPLGKVGL